MWWWWGDATQQSYAKCPHLMVIYYFSSRSTGKQIFGNWEGQPAPSCLNCLSADVISKSKEILMQMSSSSGGMTTYINIFLQSGLVMKTNKLTIKIFHFMNPSINRFENIEKNKSLVCLYIWQDYPGIKNKPINK